MQKACWKINLNDEACYIDVEEETEIEKSHHRDEGYSSWNHLPDLLLEQIFGYLSMRERYYASLVCSEWYRAFHLPRVWSNFLVEDNTLTRAKFNYYSGWQYVLDHLRTQSCLTRIGRYVKGLDFRPIYSFHNLFQFMTLITWYMEQSQEAKCPAEAVGIGVNIKRLSYVFPCSMTSTDDPEGVKLFGTGGQLLVSLKRLMCSLTQLRMLRLVDLMLERYNAKHLLDEVLQSCCNGLRTLHLVNVTVFHCPIMHVGLFFNLQTLIISPQNIDDDVLLLLADSKLRNLHLLQNRYSPLSIQIAACSAKAWRIVKRDNPTLRVHLRVERAITAGTGRATTNNGAAADGGGGRGEGDRCGSSANMIDILLQPEAPVYSIVYHSPITRVSSINLVKSMRMYSDTLAIYGHESMPKYQTPKHFNLRNDTGYVLMAQTCSKLKLLTIRERVSTGTLLLIAHTSAALNRLYVRRNAVVLKCEWQQRLDWTDVFYDWLRFNARSYERTEQEISQLLGYRWTMLSDKEFANMSISTSM